MGGGDSAFLYVLFTFQFFVSAFGIYQFCRKAFGSKEYKKEKRVTPFKLCM
jgi:preprotein translocase subunit Sec63